MYLCNCSNLTCVYVRIEKKYFQYTATVALIMKKSLKDHAMEITKIKKKNIKLLTKEQQKSYENAKICYICKKKLRIKM